MYPFESANGSFFFISKKQREIISVEKANTFNRNKMSGEFRRTKTEMVFKITLLHGKPFRMSNNHKWIDTEMMHINNRI